jgi:hypothetical protein
MLPAYQQLPPALLAAREDEALAHGRVMYGLIKPTKDMKQIESTAAMVNVIPKKRYNLFKFFLTSLHNNI